MFKDPPYFKEPQYQNMPDSDSSKQWASYPLFKSDPFDPSSLVIMPEFLQTKPKVVRKSKGIGGDEEEMMANLDVSLKVGRFDRAASLINRLGQFHPIGSPEYLAIHNRFLEAMVSHMIVTRQHTMVPSLQRWFEFDMPNGGVQPDANTLAIMLRMALRMVHGPRRDREVRKYWDLVKQKGVEEEVLVHRSLGELELRELSEICSTDFQRVSTDGATPISYEPRHAVEDDVAHVKEVEQKGLGLSSLKKSLSLFTNNSDFPSAEEMEDMDEEKIALYKRMRQQRLEADAVQSALDRWRDEFVELQSRVGLNASAGGKRVGALMSEWNAQLVSGIKRELELIAEAEATPVRTRVQASRCEYGVYLRTLNPEKLAAFTILSTMAMFGKNGVNCGLKVTSLVSQLGKELQDEIIAEKSIQRALEEDGNRRRLNMLKDILSKRKQKAGHIKWKAIAQKLGEEDPTIYWPPRVSARVGAVLLSLLFDAAKVPVQTENPETKGRTVAMQPAFHHSYQIHWGKRMGLVHINSEVVQMIVKEPSAELVGRHLPMVCEPKPWTGWKDGGFHTYKNPLIRVTPGETMQPDYVKAALEKNGLDEIRKGLDVLGKTGWAVNRRVLDVMLEAWNSGEPIANLAPANPNLDHPPRPAPEEGVEAEKAWMKAVRDIEDKRSGIHSNRCFQNFQLEVARAYRNETFHLPHNMDFRGRAYPLPPYLNQMGADNSRGLLLFSDAKPLGERGLRWLKIQLANLYGFDKGSFAEREQFVMDHLDDVFDSADNGLHGKRWWLQAEDPWQCLAACVELTSALRLPDPTKYASRLPIHQDGSCNGLQHYAALGGDIIGAQQVNLEPADRPSDVYTGVAEYVKEQVSREAAEGNPIAKSLDGKITRKIVKQTVMTNVYGVTFHGAIKQVCKQLVDHYPDLQGEWSCATYIASKIFRALGSMFTGAHEIQYWLGDCASRITQSLSPDQIEMIAKATMTPKSEEGTGKIKDPSEHFKTTVIWTTPLGLPVVQPYRTRKSRRIYTTLQDISIVESTSDAVISKRKQLQAFPPNFIHSLDATHMMLSANACNQAGLTFSAVHDSFWTHACDVDSMNNILRDAFVKMHSDDVIKRLAAEFKARYGRNLFLAKIRRGTTIEKHILNFRKTHGSKGKVPELIEEYRRQTLLSSEDPELQAQGRAMETAASMFEKMKGADDDLAIPNSLGETAVGHVPDNAEPSELKMSVDMNDPAIESLFSSFDMPNNAASDLKMDDAKDGEVADKEEVGAKKKRKTRVPDTTWVWLPLNFRDIPTKGDWDVTRILKSQYFFS